MNVEEFEAYYRDQIDTVLNLLQTVNLLVAQLQIQSNSLNNMPEAVQTITQIAQNIEAQTLEIGMLVQQLSTTIEAFLQED